MTVRRASPETVLAQAGAPLLRGRRSPGPKPLSDPITLASVWRFENLDQVDSVWEGRVPGHIYRRFGHPNAASLERVIAALEEAEDALATSSGMGALVTALLGHGRSGDVVVAQEGLYGGTQAFLAGELSRLGFELALVPEPTREAFAATLDRVRRQGRRAFALLIETIANPSLAVADVPGLCALAGERGLLLIVDNTFATPLACRPLRWGPALVAHSLTKYMNGHSDVLGGALAGPKALVDPARAAAKAIGAGIAPFDAWLTLRSLRTLHLRFERQQANAARVAAWLEGRPGVARVLYPGLASHPSHKTARRVLGGFGAMVSFVLAGGDPAVRRFLAGLDLVTFAPSLGETATTISYPAVTSHRSLSLREKEVAGAGLGLLRLSLGTEAVEDILADLEQALAACG